MHRYFKNTERKRNIKRYMKHLYVFQFNKNMSLKQISPVMNTQIWTLYMSTLYSHNINNYFIEMELQLKGCYC